MSRIKKEERLSKLLNTFFDKNRAKLSDKEVIEVFEENENFIEECKNQQPITINHTYVFAIIAEYSFALRLIHDYTKSLIYLNSAQDLYDDIKSSGIEIPLDIEKVYGYILWNKGYAYYNLKKHWKAYNNFKLSNQLFPDELAKRGELESKFKFYEFITKAVSYFTFIILILKWLFTDVEIIQDIGFFITLILLITIISFATTTYITKHKLKKVIS